MKNLDQDTVPTTLEEAVKALHDALEPSELAMMKTHSPGSVHNDFGRFLRNAWTLWEDTPLTRDIKKRFGLFGHGDDMSGIILHKLWERVIGNPPWISPDQTVEALVARYKSHWRSSGIDPATGQRIV